MRPDRASAQGGGLQAAGLRAFKKRKSAHPSGAGGIAGPRHHVTACCATPPCANPYNEHLRSNGVLDVLIGLVIATFIIAGAYVGYHYSQDPGNFESHDVEMPHAPQALSTPHHAGHGAVHALHAPDLGERGAGAAL